MGWKAIPIIFVFAHCVCPHPRHNQHSDTESKKDFAPLIDFAHVARPHKIRDTTQAAMYTCLDAFGGVASVSWIASKKSSRIVLEKSNDAYSFGEIKRERWIFCAVAAFVAVVYSNRPPTKTPHRNRLHR
jgi:hypothetical protein